MKTLIENIGNILPQSIVDELAKDGWLADAAVDHTKKNSPHLDYLTELYRRNQIKVPAVTELIEHYLESFNYGRLA